jgi:hypothetical protein
MQAILSVVWFYVEGVWVRSIVTNPSDYGGPFGKVFSKDSTFGKVTNLTYQISLQGALCVTGYLHSTPRHGSACPITS